LLLHLVGPDKVSISAKDKKIFSECLRIFETLGTFAGEFGGGVPVLEAVCKELYGFAEIAGWYKLTPERKRIFSVFRKIDSACKSYKPPGSTVNSKKEIDLRQAVVCKCWDKAKRIL
jgi:hypothetical protein